MAAVELGPRAAPGRVAAAARRRGMGRPVVAETMARSRASGVGRQAGRRRTPTRRRRRHAARRGHVACRADASSPTAPTNCARVSCVRPSPARSPGPSCSASPAPGPTSPGSAPRAVRDGDEWIVNGQKVWTTSAHHADYGMLLARTDWDVPKHQGITYFVLAMNQPGVEVRPLLQMNGHSSFNEVFLTDARVPAVNLVGDLGDGWRVARTTLMHERTLRHPATADRSLTARAAGAIDGGRSSRGGRSLREPTRGTRSAPAVPTSLPNGRSTSGVRPTRSFARRSPSWCRSSAPTNGRPSEHGPHARSVGLRARRVRSASSQRAKSPVGRRAFTVSSPALRRC